MFLCTYLFIYLFLLLDLLPGFSLGEPQSLDLSTGLLSRREPMYSCQIPKRLSMWSAWGKPKGTGCACAPQANLADSMVIAYNLYA